MRTLAKFLCAALLPLLLHGQAPARKRAADVIRPDFADLSYGPHANNKLDLWLVKSGTPAPLLVFIHGGGFVGGDKSVANPAFIRRALDAGVSFASINYRFRTEVPIQTVLRDCARAIQFLRWKAAEFHLDKTRVASMGGSAGAGTSLWLAFHDDLADPRSADPVLRESSRLTAAASNAGQATYDVLKWKDFLGDAAERFYRREDAPKFYGVRTLEQLNAPEGLKIRADVDMLGLITKDDAPVYLAARSRHDGLRNLGDVNHSAKHSIAVKKRCDEVGVPAVLRIDAGENGAIEFILAHLTGRAP